MKFDQKSSRYIKVKKEVTGTEKRRFLVNLKAFKNCAFLGPVTSIYFFCNYLKNTPSGHFVFYDIFVAQTYITNFLCVFSQKVEKLNITAIYNQSSQFVQ